MRRVIFFTLAPIVAFTLPYTINFVGLRDQTVLKAMFDASDLVTLQDRPPASINGLRYRIAADTPALLKVLRAYGYYDAMITSDIEVRKGEFEVSLFIHPGPQYALASYEIYMGDCTIPASIPNCAPFSPERLGLEIGTGALSVNIVNAELKLLSELSRCGYPLATVEKRKVEVDMAEKEVKAASCINEGPFSKFGPITIFGLKGVKPRYITRKIAWKEGQIYNNDYVEETQKRLLNSDLFSSVLISHEEQVDAEGELPMKMRLTEAKHRQVSLGVFYATVDGFGGSFAWTHRNLRGMGEIFSVNGDFSQRYLAGTMTYKKPDFLRLNQTYRVVGAISREDIRAYTAFIYSAANFIERKLDPRRSGSIGFEIAHYNVSDSASNGTYLFAALPFFAKYNTSENVLDPTKGLSVVYQMIPYQSLFFSNQHFVKQRLTTNFYIPLRTSRIILALRAQFGSIAGSNQENIPLPVLFLGGSEDDLRGYRYKTVSPLDDEGDPLGGRSAIFTSVEIRIRVTKTIGLVPFADFGTVTLSEIPQVDAKWFKSVGGGLRYFTFFGPLRFDIGFPLDKRKHLDKNFQIYASIGQSF